MESGGLNSRFPVAAVDGMAIVIDATAGPIWDNQSISAKSATVTITSAQVKNLLASPVEILAAPPSGYANFVVNASVKSVYGGTNAFTNAQATRLYWGSKSGSQASGQWSTSTISQTSTRAASVVTVSSTAFPSSNIEATNIVFCNDGATDVTGNAAGNNTVKVSINYVTVKI